MLSATPTFTLEERESAYLAYMEEELRKIGSLSHFEMARLWRFAPCGHPYFILDSPLHQAFQARFNQHGGWTAEISKQVGW